jgi:hypothetical protein
MPNGETLEINTTLPTSFKKIGFLAEDATLAHLRTEIKIDSLRDKLDQALTATNYSLERIAFNRGEEISKRLKPYYNSMRDSLKTPERLIDLLDLMFFNDTAPLNDREKRQVLLAAAATLNLGLSLYNTYEIFQLEEQTSQLQEENKHIVSILKEEHLAINTLSQSIETLNKTMLDYALDFSKISNQIELMSAYSFMHTKVETFTQETALFYDGLLELTQGRLSPHLIDKQKIALAVNDLSAKVAKQGFHLLHPQLSSIFKNEISYIVQNRTLIIFIHVPIIRSNKYPLYEYLETPLLIENDQAPLMFVSSPKGTFLAIDEQHSKKGIELTSSMLANCHVEKTAIGNTYLCHDSLSILSNDITQSCLGLLFTNTYDEQMLLKKCDIKFSAQEEFWQQVDGNTFILYAKEPIKLTQSCPISLSQANVTVTMIKGLNIITLNQGCSVYTPSYSLVGKSTFSLEREFIYLPKQVTFTPQIFDPIQLSNVYNQLSSLKVPSQIDFRELEEWQRTHHWRTHSLSIGGAFLMLTMMIALAVSGYLLWTYLKFRRGAVRPPSAPPNEGLELHEHPPRS